MISAAVDTQGERFSQPAGGPTSLVDLPNTVRPIVSHNPNRKKVLFVTSEFADLVKTGGLGDAPGRRMRSFGANGSGPLADQQMGVHYDQCRSRYSGRAF